jgi:hypothetical protein
MISWIERDTPFPAVESARRRAMGCAGSDLSRPVIARTSLAPETPMAGSPL